MDDTPDVCMMFDQKAYSKQYRAEHKEEIKEQNRHYHAEHKERDNERSRQRHAAHKEEDNERCRQHYYAHGGQPMSENQSCPAFLGVHIAERMLAHLFKNVVRMPANNSGYDFICNNGHKIDVKSGCRRIDKRGADNWLFYIRRNTAADYFLCIAFDNHDDLNPQHLWLIPGKKVSHLVGAGIAESTLDKWSEYEKPINEAINCCNTIRGE